MYCGAKYSQLELVNIHKTFKNFLTNFWYLNIIILVSLTFYIKILTINSHELKFLRGLLKYWSSSQVFNKLVIKSKNTCKDIFYVYKKVLKLTMYFYFFKIWFYYYYLRDLVVCTPNKTRLYIYFWNEKIFSILFIFVFLKFW
jgi:hypothetical protein